ncbi:hypothetical protein [Jeotgalibacillus marinus]|uniref:Uncharacterized protein n=1 Tax=Jeotgalibacillus marinus TaxID=86667 RepID=A0ABV3Q484_9BACL
MIKTITNIKSAEFKNSLKSLDIDSKTNLLFIKYLSVLFIVLLLLFYFFYPIQILTLVHLLNINVFSISINPVNIILLITLISGNKNIIHIFKNDFYAFYGSKNSFLFFYIKEKYYILISILLFEVIIIHSTIIKLLTIESLLAPILLFVVGLSINVFYIHYVTKGQLKISGVVKYLITLLVFGILLFSVSENWLQLGAVPNYVVVNLPLLYLIANLFIYSELIILDSDYKQLFFMYKYLKTPFFITWNKSVLFKRTYPLYLGIAILVILFLFKVQFETIAIFYYMINLVVGYIVLLYLNYKTVMYEAYISQKNFFLYFVVIEIFFIFVVINVFLVR